MSLSPKPILPILAVSLAALLLVAGCGGSDSSPTKAEFIKQADAICKKQDNRKGKEIEDFLLKAGEKTLTIAQQGEMATDVILPPLRTEADELAELDVPEGDEDTVDAIFDEFDELVAKLEKNPLPLAQTTLNREDPFAKVAEKAGKYGFKACLLYY